MTPHRENNGGFRQQYPDPLEVTRTTSNNSMENSIPDSPTSSRLSATPAVSECDYDTNPTVLYQAIEAKQWDYAISLFTNRGSGNSNSSVGTPSPEEIEDEEEASATWVVRKECNGKLRWRLLPLHAAIIFGSPLKLIELLLVDYPLAAQCKDDRGMLPLHLAFRHRASWDVIDELLTTYPLAVFVSDRKGRTPLKCGLSKSLPRQAQSEDNKNGNAEASVATASFQTITGVLELYSQISVSGERKRVEQETRNLAQTSISQIRGLHHRQLEAIRAKIDAEKTESNQKLERLETEKLDLQKRLELLEEKVAERDQSHAEMSKKLRLMTVQLNLANERAEANASAHADANNIVQSSSSASSNSSSQTQPANTAKSRSIDKMLRMMAETVVKQQKAYQGRVKELLTSYEDLVAEREAMRSILVKDSDASHPQEGNEALLLQSFQKWFQSEGEKLSQQERSLSLSPLSSPSPSSRSIRSRDPSPCKGDTNATTTTTQTTQTTQTRPQTTESENDSSEDPA